MNSADQLQVAIATARGVVSDIATSLPASVDPAMFTLKSKTPFAAVSVREVLIHRVSALAIPAVEQFEAHRFLAGIVLTRSVLETVAIAFAVERALNRFLRVQNKEAVHKYLMQVLLARGTPGSKYKPMDITGLVDSLDKKSPGIRQTYNNFSECVHPNWSGTLATFGTTDENTLILHLGARQDSPTWGAGVHALTGALIEFQRIYAALPRLITEMDNYFEQHDA